MAMQGDVCEVVSSVSDNLKVITIMYMRLVCVKEAHK